MLYEYLKSQLRNLAPETNEEVRSVLGFLCLSCALCPEYHGAQLYDSEFNLIRIALSQGNKLQFPLIISSQSEFLPCQRSRSQIGVNLIWQF